MEEEEIGFNEKCYHCGSKDIWVAHDIFCSDGVLWRYRVPLTGCDYCPKCNTYYLGSRSMKEEEKHVHDLQCSIALKRFPFNEKNWMLLEEAYPIIGHTAERFWKYCWPFFFITEQNGRWYILRKSVEHFLYTKNVLHDGTGLFWLGKSDEIDECYRD